MRTRLLTITLMLAVCGLTTHVDASTLDERIAAFTDASSLQDEAAVTAILQAGLAERRSAEALAEVQPWLNRNHLKSEEGLYHAAKASEYSGQWLAAVGYYQRLLQTPEPDPKLAGQAADAVYYLLLNALGDQAAAYNYMRQDGNRIRGYGRAKRYDRWFLDQARERDDLVAVADRLTTIMRDRAADPADFERDLTWLCQQFETFDPREPTVYEAAKRLAEVKRTPAVFSARLNWVATVMPYNQRLDELRQANAPADPELTNAPLAAAAQLLKVAPDRATLVAKGWGVEYDHGHSGNCAKRFNVEGERKLKQLLEVVPRMSPDKRDDLLAYDIAQGRVKFDPVAVRDLVLKYPDMLNRLDAADVPLFDKERTTVEDARKLAPLLARNPHRDAALIRAIAASGSMEFGPIADAIIKSEMWRFDSPKAGLEVAYRNAIKQEQEQFRQALAEHQSFGNPHAQLLKQVGKPASSQQRLAAFNTLRKDLISGTPSIPGVLHLWDELLKNAPNGDKAVMLQKLTAAFIEAPAASKESRKHLLSRTLQQLEFGNAYSRLSMDPAFVGGWDRWGYKNLRKALPDYVDYLEKLLREQMKAGTLKGPVFTLWLHCVAPEDQASDELMKQIINSPAYVKLDPVYHRMASHRLLAGERALTDKTASDPHVVSRPLLNLPNDASRQQVESALAAVIKRASSAPAPVAVIGLGPVAELPAWSDTVRRQVLSLFRENAPIGGYPSQRGYEPVIEHLADESREQKNWDDLEPYLAGLWNAAGANDHHVHDGVPRLIALAETVLDAGDHATALSIARSGLASRVGQYFLNHNNDRYTRWSGRLKQVEGKASIELGIIDIPVEPSDPAYPIYQSQAEFAVGNTDAAWEIYTKHADRVEPVLRELTVAYCLWLLERNIEQRESDRAEQLIRGLTIWSRQEAGTFTPQQDAELKIAYADAALQRGALQTAKAWYRRVADADEHAGTPLQYQAMLRSVDVDRAARDFGSAMAELDKLMRVRDEDLRMRVHFARAEVLFDQENYAAAFAEVSTVLRRDPDHADALILLGQAQLKMRQLVDASEIELGVSRDQELLVPGEAIKIDLNDPALNISGLGADIEVEVTAASGDRERLKLYQLGDDKTRFRAEVPTTLGKPEPGDKVLQLLGRDEVRYGYSKRFREKVADLPPDPDVVIRVASDSHIAASAGAFPRRAGEQRLNLEELGVDTAQQALGRRRVRPGNPVYVRVTDPDQSRTGDIDQVVVTVQASSGDLIPRLVLKETGPYTGEFEATIPTGRAPALAYASESAPGRDANMVISGEPYPGWAGETGSKAATRDLTIDLNDNVAPARMTIKCTDAAQVPTRFVLQTSMNGREWATHARFPDDPAPWQGKPQITVFPTYGHRAIAVSEPQGPQVPEDWREKMDILSIRGGVAYDAFAVPGLGDVDMGLPSGGHPGYSVLLRYRAVFYQPAAAIRTFKLTGLPTDAKGTFFLINGKPADPQAGSPLTITRELDPGLHEIEIWRHESRGSLEKRKPRLLCDVDGQDELQPCPPEMFDPDTFPTAVRDAIHGPTRITTTEQTPNQFDVAFGENTRARMVRLVIVEHEGAAPAIHKITLTDREQVRRLPVATDYQTLRANDQLEVVPGDTVSLRYEDDQTVTPRRNIQQQRLSVAYNTATISASFLNYEMTDEGRELVLEPIRRFKLDDSVGIVITDPDLDQTRERDQLPFTVQASNGQPVELVALETGPHTGVFVGSVFPVSTEPTRAADIPVEPGGTLTARYRDMENLEPGIPTDRAVVIEHARFTPPELAVYDTSTRPLPEVETDASEQEQIEERGPEIIRPRRSIGFAYTGLDDARSTSASAAALVGSSLRFDVLVPHLAFAPSSEIVAYIQTDAGRRAWRESEDYTPSPQPFDINAFGTLKLTARPARGREVVTPPGYELRSPPSPPSSRPALDEGRFAFSVPIALGDVAMRSYATEAAEALPASQRPDALAIRPGDKVHVGFAYLDPDGVPQWLTTTVGLASHPFLDVMEGRYRRALETAFVGERVYVRLIAPSLDLGPGRDLTTVDLKAASGVSVAYRIRETEAHSGVFKGAFKLRYADDEQGGPLPSVALHGLPVKYGDRVTISYPGTGPDAPPARTVRVNKGADGFIEPFSKRYGDDSVAIQTTFTLAECFFELAKHHRKMDQESLARREMGHAQKLLAEAIANHRDESMQAHAQYLLGNLAQEYADLSKNTASKRKMYQDALARFSKIPLDYPDTEFAPKAQFKKGLVYEKLGELDIAVEEYVKLAYKYPDHELIPSVMSRLGSYFQSQGKQHKTRAEALEQREDDTEAQGEAIRLRELAAREYLNAAQVFRKLQERFPTDPLAGLAGLRSGQNFMRARDYDAAIAAFEVVVNNETYDDKDVRSQALFWTGISYERMSHTGDWRTDGRNRREAYQTYRRVTFDFPDSVWAKQARGRLADPFFADIIEKEKKARERMLEALKEQRKNQ